MFILEEAVNQIIFTGISLEGLKMVIRIKQDIADLRIHHSNNLHHKISNLKGSPSHSLVSPS